MKETISTLQSGKIMTNGKKQLRYNDTTFRYEVTGGSKDLKTLSIKEAINFLNE